MTSHRTPPAVAALVVLACGLPVLPAAAGPGGLPPSSAGPAAPTVLPATADPGATATLSGTVEDHFASGWIVELVPAGADAPAHSVSTGDGTAFEFTGVAPGEYLLRASHPAGGTVGPATPITLRPGDNGSTTLIFTGPAPGDLPGMLGPLTGRVEGAAPDATSVVVEVLHDRDGELVAAGRSPVAADGTFSVDPQVVEGYALPIHLRAVQALPDGSTRTVYHGGSPAPGGSTPIVPAEGVQTSYVLSFAPAPAPTSTAPATTSATTPAAPAPEATSAAADEEAGGPTAGAWVLLAAGALAAVGLVVVLLRRRTG